MEYSNKVSLGRQRRRDTKREDYIDVRIEQLSQERDNPNNSEEDSNWYNRIIQELYWVKQQQWSERICGVQLLGWWVPPIEGRWNSYTPLQINGNIMSTTNDITGDKIQSKTLSKQGRDNWDNIFGKKKKTDESVKKKKVINKV